METQNLNVSVPDAAEVLSTKTIGDITLEDFNEL